MQLITCTSIPYADIDFHLSAYQQECKYDHRILHFDDPFVVNTEYTEFLLCKRQEQTRSQKVLQLSEMHATRSIWGPARPIQIVRVTSIIRDCYGIAVRKKKKDPNVSNRDGTFVRISLSEMHGS